MQPLVYYIYGYRENYMNKNKRVKFLVTHSNQERLDNIRGLIMKVFPKNTIYMRGSILDSVSMVLRKDVDIALIDLSTKDIGDLRGIEAFKTANADMPIIIICNILEKARALSAIMYGADNYFVLEGYASSLVFDRTIAGFTGKYGAVDYLRKFYLN